MRTLFPLPIHASEGKESVSRAFSSWAFRHYLYIQYPGFTPLTLATKLGRKEIFDEMLELMKVVSYFVCSVNRKFKEIANFECSPEGLARLCNLVALTYFFSLFIF